MFRSILLYSSAIGLLACQSVTERFEIAEQYVPHGSQSNSIEFNATLPIHYKAIRKGSPLDENATIYIEGDGFAYITKSRPSSNSTPKTPVGLMLAAQDKASQASVLHRAPVPIHQGRSIYTKM